MTLEFILNVKAGIGRSFHEAEAALNQAKALKEKIKDSDTPQVARDKVLAKIRTREYAIVLYAGDPLRTSGTVDFKAQEALEKDVADALADMNALRREYGFGSSACLRYERRIKSQSHDAATGALTPFGYVLQQQQQPNVPMPPGMERFYILIDANDMHYWNNDDKAGYEDVTRHINAIGRGVVKGTRHEMVEGSHDPRRKLDAGISDKVLKPETVRTHVTAGDEFLIELWCREQDVVRITQRLFERVYAEQRNLYEDFISEPISS